MYSILSETNLLNLVFKIVCIGKKNLFFVYRLLNANKINCLRVNTFQDLHNLNLLSLYDNKLQTISKGLFAPLQSIQTL